MYGLIRNNEIDSVLLGRARRIPADALYEFTARLRAAARATHRPIEN
ncbi:hypothetical protein Ae505Ps2_1059 [Pseudonocardia sp. Ae505_Ps2]|nr:hypothetical protein Ae505Ps2_1059 [Pseudonocardia sp. Ae505_Ps2]